VAGSKLGVVGIVLGSLGMIVAAEELLAGAFAGALNDGGGVKLQTEAGHSVALAGGVMLAMSIFLLVVGILLVLGRGWKLARIWAVLGLLAAAALTVNAITDRELLAKLAARQVASPGFINDLGGAKPLAFALLAVFPIALLVFGPKRKPLATALD
jgi:hypothetical protein